MFEFKNGQSHHHASPEGRQDLLYMREDIIKRYFNGEEKQFKAAFLNYQIRLYQLETQNFGDC